MLPIQKVIEKISNRMMQIPIGHPQFADIRYTPYRFSVNNFNPIRTTDCKIKIGFVDGGNTPVYDSSNIAVCLSRIYFNIYKDRIRINPKHLPQRMDFYVICYAVAENERVFYETELVPVMPDWAEYLPDSKDLKFYSFDPSLMTGRFRVPISRIAETARRFAEWKYAGLMIEQELDEGDAIIRDGSLQTTVTNERKYANNILKNAIDHDVVLLGLSKTSTLFTSTGYPLFAAVAELSEQTTFENGAWYYYPIVSIDQPDHRAEMYAVKLHPSSEYVFRLEFLQDQAKMMSKDEINKYIFALSENAKDLSFPGYPYGLIDADRFARVSGSEKARQSFQFFSCASSSGVLKRLKKCLKTSDAHEILNQLIGA
jgi:hypothetical protein